MGVFELLDEHYNMQQGGKKKPLIVNDKNDPRYKAYQDSLTVYNANKYERDYYDKNIKPFVKTKDIEDLNDKWYYGINGKIIDEGNNAELRLEDRNKKPYKFANYPKTEGEKFFGITDAWYPRQEVSVKKIQQPNVYTDKDGSQFSTGDNKLTGKPQLVKRITEIPPREKVAPLQTLTSQGVTQNNQEIISPLPTFTPQAQIPNSFNIEYLAQRMNGGTGYYGQNNVQGVDIETALRAQEQADRMNQYWQEKYGNSQNPKAQERLQQLNDSVKITPNYQQGGEIKYSKNEKKFLEEVARLKLI